MSNEKFLKITYHGGGASKNATKINAYLKMPSPTYAVVLQEIFFCIFEQRQQPRTELRTYWIDEDGDEIDIVDQCDYDIFMSKRSERRHMQVAPVVVETESTKATPITDNASAGVDDSPFAQVVHARVECDGCEAAPIVGFRYKCVQCDNFDLCERCEAQHKHPEHMMVRMPNDKCPNIVQSWITGGRSSGRRHFHKQRSGSGTCPFAAAAATAGDATAPPTEDKKEHSHHHGRHGRKHQRRQMQNGIFTHLYNMMQDLAEGGGPPPAFDTDSDAPSTPRADEKTAPNADVHAAAQEAANKAAAAAATVAHEMASKAASAAAAAAAAAMFGVPPTAAASTAPKEANNKPEEGKTGAVPKTPPPTPNSSATTEPEFKKATASSVNADAPGVSTPPITIPLLDASSPILENVAQFVDPQYMKAGIQILNNFSEMFAKMLDPMEGSSDASNNSGMEQQQRKNSCSSTASSATNLSASTKTSEVNKIAEPMAAAETEKKRSAEEEEPKDKSEKSLEERSVVVDESLLSVEGAAVVANTLQPDSTAERERSRSQSEENDWQLIEKQSATESLQNISVTSTESAEAIAAATVSDKVDAAAPAVVEPTLTQAVQVNYEQLSQTLRQHVADEMRKEREAKRSYFTLQSTPAVPVYKPAVPVYHKADEMRKEREAKGPYFTLQSTPAVPVEQRAVPVYHKDPRINQSVCAMMAMGFSNEGAWLTQLLASVEGSIPQALELMGTAQHNTR